MDDLDCIIIGAGHNGLTCAAYLGMAGLKVRVLERRKVVGGAAVTEEFHPGFRNSVAAYTVSLLQPKVIRDLKLHEHGLRIVERRAQNFLPTTDGRYLLTGEGRTEREIAKFSPRDAARYGDYQAEIGRVADVLRSLVMKAPPNLVLGNFSRAMGELGKLAALGKQLWQSEAQRTAFACSANRRASISTAGSRSAPIKAVLGFDSIVGNLASPYTPGSAYVLLHHMFGEVNGKRGVWGHAIGGMGAITQAMARAAGEYGVTIETGKARARDHHRARSRGRRRVGRRHAGPRARGDLQCRSAIPVPGSGAARGACRPRLAKRMQQWKCRLRHVPHERRAVEAAGASRALPGAPATITPRASSSRRAWPTWIAPMTIASSTAGAASRSSRC